MLDRHELRKIADHTLEHYNRRAEAFWEGTRDHDVRQNIDALLNAIDGEPPFAVLDFGCGPGRDLKTFAALGHQAVGLEGSAKFAEMARIHSGCEVWQQDFLALDLPDQRFDGVFANASLFHVPGQELPRVLKELRSCLKARGVLFSSNPRGDNSEGWNDGRYGAFHDLRVLAPLWGSRRFRRSDPLLPACRPAPRASTVAGQRLAENRMMKFLVSAMITLAALIGAAHAAEGDPLVLFCDDHYPPLGFQENHQPKGLVIDILHILEQRIARRIDIRMMDWEAAQGLVAQGQGDGLCDAAITEARRQTAGLLRPDLHSDVFRLHPSRP